MENFFSADSSIFDVFTIKIINGNPTKLLTKGEDVIVSRKTALKFFGSADVIGTTFRSINDQNYIIRAVYEDFPSNSHIHPSFIASSISSQLNQELKWDQSINYLTYLLIDSKSSVDQVQHSMDQIVEQNLPDQFKSNRN